MQLLPPLTRLRQLAPRVEAERLCKSLVRPKWKPARWRQDDLHDRPWPPLLGRECLRSTLFSTESLDHSQPAILEGALDSWPDKGLWELDVLLKEYGSKDFVVGSQDGLGSEQIPVTMTLEAYCEYSQRQEDDCPLYIFDEKFLDGGHALAGSYCRPPCFEEDLMAGLGADRPPHRWLLIGCERAGTALHVDPFETAAWNTLVFGKKRWVVFPPDVDASRFEVPEEEDVADSAAHWLHLHYPHLGDVGCLDFIQRAGETVYIPNGWWHNVVNLEFSVAVTENFVDRHNLAASHASMQQDNPKLAASWLHFMKEDEAARPLLASLQSAGEGGS